MTKRPFGHGDIRHMGNFKANAADYAYYLSLSDEGRLYCLTDRQVYALQVQLDYIGWMTRWYNVEDITQTTLQYIRADIEERLMSCVDVQILVDQANENLITTVTNRAIQSQVLRDVLEARYDGTPTSINADAPTSTWSYGGSGDGKSALCSALMAFVYQAARAQADSVRAGQVGGLAAVALVAALLIPGLNVFFLAGAAIAVLLGLGTIGVTTEVAIQALTDTAALDEVVCYMRDQLQAASVNATTWNNSLNSYPFGTGTHAAIVADFLKSSLASNYLPFLNIIGTGYGAVTTDQAVPECPCDTGCRHIDAAHDLEALFEPSGGIGPQASWNGTGWAANTGLINSRITLQADFLAPLAISSIRIVFSGTNAVGGVNEVTMFTEDFGSVLSSVEFEEESTLYPGVTIQKFEIDVVSSFDQSVPITVYITDMYIEYSGAAPSWGEPC